MNSLSPLGDHPSNRIERRENAAGLNCHPPPSTTRAYDPHATDELLALLGAEPTPSAGEKSTAPRIPPRSSTDDEPGISARHINDIDAAHGTGHPEAESPFLARIIQAEGRIHNRVAAATTKNEWSFGDDDSSSDGFGGWRGVDDGRFDGNDGANNHRDVNINAVNNVLHSNNGQDKEETEPAYSLSNFTLPSADESSSSEEEDGEEGDDDDHD
jgi:hypothetical protein